MIEGTVRLASRLAVVSVGVAILSGCNSVQSRDAPAFEAAPQAPEGYATLYIYRPGESDYAMAVWPVLFINDVKVADVKVYSYTCIYLKPGDYNVRSEKSQALTFFGKYTYTFSIPAPGSYYLEFSTGVAQTTTFAVGGAFVPLTTAQTAHEGFLLVPPEVALPKMQRNRYLAPAVQKLGNQGGTAMAIKSDR